MIFRPRDTEEENDYFDGPDLPDPEERKVEEKKEEKKPRYTPEDPRYWEDEENEWEPLPTPRRSLVRKLILYGGALLAIILLTVFYIRWFTPVVTDATQAGYIEKIQKEGQFLKSFEGRMLPYRELMDTARVYDEDFQFSTRNDTVAARLKMAELRGEPVRVTYKRYRHVLPWKGNTEVTVIAVDSVDPAKLLPPDRRPEQPEPEESTEQQRP